jgi:Succinylglutamate desuccinylase / Aspartoacylase family
MVEEVARSRRFALAFTAGAVVIAAASGWIFWSMHGAEPIVAGPGVTAQHMLGEYQPNIEGGDGDTPVFELKGAKDGPTLMVLGGTHPQEIAGMLAAVLLVENARVTQGRLIVVPQANRSGFTHTEPMEAYYHSFEIQRPDGTKRWFRVGMRLTNPVDQWPDPITFVHLPSGERMIGLESRNLNRNHPGLDNGTLTAEVSHGIVTLAKGSDMVIDLHESKPENTLSNSLIAHERGFETGAYASEFLKAENIPIKFDKSPKDLHGLSHREFGDFTKAQAMLAETTNPAQGYFRGRLSMDLLLRGKDPGYVEAAKLKRLFVPFDENGWPIEKRVARHLTTVKEIVTAYNELHPKAPIVIEGIPSYDDLIKNGIGAYLNPPPK